MWWAWERDVYSQNCSHSDIVSIKLRRPAFPIGMLLYFRKTSFDLGQWVSKLSVHPNTWEGADEIYRLQASCHGNSDTEVWSGTQKFTFLVSSQGDLLAILTVRFSFHWGRENKMQWWNILIRLFATKMTSKVSWVIFKRKSIWKILFTNQSSQPLTFISWESNKEAKWWQYWPPKSSQNYQTNRDIHLYYVRST